MRSLSVSSCGMVLAVLLLSACSNSVRPPAPTPGVPARVPVGAVDAMVQGGGASSEVRKDLTEALNSRFSGEFETNRAGRAVFRVLVISGGGSRGSYGAGVLAGWTEAGTRPEFDVVTGISTGALISTFAFLGPAYDHVLRRYTEVSNQDIFRERNALAALVSDALRDTAPLRAVIARDIDDRTLEAVAKEHAAGRRLFVGTTNLDAGTLTVWDMGALASSDRPDKLQRYRDVVLASASFPMIFPPVYIPVEVDGETRWQMHVDGSARANVFATRFMLDLDDALERSELGHDHVLGQLWVIHNGKSPSPLNTPVSPRVTSIAEAAINSLLEVTTRGGLAELYAMSMLSGFEFAYTSIPAELELGPNALEFDPEEMSQLFEVGFQTGRTGDGWQSQPPPSEPFELLQILDPDVVKSAGGRYPDIPHRPPRWMAATAPLKEPVSLNLCTGMVGGYYELVGRKLRDGLTGKNIDVEIHETDGSIDNIRNIRQGSCDAGLVQHDAYFLAKYGLTTAASALQVQRPRYLFDEYVHVLCNRSSGVTRLSDLFEQPDRHRMLIGGAESGSAATWEVFKQLEPILATIDTEAIGGEEALRVMARDDAPACLIYVANPQSPFMRKLDDNADTIRLIMLDDRDFNNARIAGEQLYRFDRFPKGVYPGLQAELERPDIRTLTVGSSVIVADEWAEEYPAAYRLLRQAVAATRQEISQEFATD